MSTTAPAGLDAAQRSTLERLVTRARVLLEIDLAAQAEGRFGIHIDGTIEDEAALPDDTTDKVTRRDLEEIVNHLRTLGEDAPGAVARLLREAAFTHLNRLVAIRIAEAIGLLPESLANGPQSRGFRDLGEIMPVLAGDYRDYVRLCGDELAADAPALFDPRNPLLALEPTTAAFDELVALVADPGTAEIWPAPDTLGWAYQFFNTGDERREMREASAPRNSYELAVRNQFFTPRYVVDFLVQNTIGRRLIETDPASQLLEELPMLVDPPTEAGPPLDLEEVRCLDPACGSGHFLLGCYDVLERAWELSGTTPAESAPRIVASLWGVDIDPRCAQVASAVIVLRARRHCRDLSLPRPNIVTARGLPSGSAALPPDLELTAGQRSLIDRVSAVLADAPLLGTLLKAEVALSEEIRWGVFGGESGTLELADEEAEATERKLLSHLEAIAGRASSSVVERLLAAETNDALRLVDVARRRFDVVLMNPPFGSPVPSSATYLRRAYKASPAELYACFVSRGIELSKPDGVVGALTNRTGFFLSSLEGWRSSLIDEGISCFADLGSFVLEDAQVEVAAYVVGRKSQQAAFIRCLTVREKAKALATQPAKLTFAIDPAQFRNVPQTCFTYWVGEQFVSLFDRCEPFEADGRTVSRGLSAGDNFRFIRARWEVQPERIASHAWVFASKGGEYSPFFDDVHLVMYWEEADRPYRKVEGARIFNLSLQGKPGICWPKRTTSLPSARPLPTGTFFEANSIPAFSDDLELILGWANTRIFTLCFLMQVGAGDAAAKDWITGPARRLPWVTPTNDRLDHLRTLGVDAALAARRRVSASETAALFTAPECLLTNRPRLGTSVKHLAALAVDAREDIEITVLESKLALDLAWATEYDLDQSALYILDVELEPNPASYKPDGPISADTFAAAYLSKDPIAIEEEIPNEQLVDSRVEARMRSQVGHRSLEDLCHLFALPPRAVAAERRSLSYEKRICRESRRICSRISWALPSVGGMCGSGKTRHLPRHYQHSLIRYRSVHPGRLSAQAGCPQPRLFLGTRSSSHRSGC